jgi:MYXO-CTERM domain-containing protein
MGFISYSSAHLISIKIEQGCVRIYKRDILPGVYPGPVGATAGEIAAERAFAGTDNSLRYHSNLDAVKIRAGDLLSVTFDALNLHTAGGNPRYGVEVWFNGIKVMDEVEINPGNLHTDITTAQFSASSVNATPGAGFDNVVELRGINYNSSGGGNWMGVDYVRLDVQPVPEPASATLGLMAMSALGLRRRRRRTA